MAGGEDGLLNHLRRAIPERPRENLAGRAKPEPFRPGARPTRKCAAHPTSHFMKNALKFIIKTEVFQSLTPESLFDIGFEK
jgi:hypothetical protein